MTWNGDDGYEAPEELQRFYNTHTVGHIKYATQTKPTYLLFAYGLITLIQLQVLDRIYERTCYTDYRQAYVFCTLTTKGQQLHMNKNQTEIRKKVTSRGEGQLITPILNLCE